jgi:hypothetical protein
MVSRKLARARATLVGVIAMLTASLAGLAGVEGFQAYDCSNSSNPVDMYSLLDPEPCPGDGSRGGEDDARRDRANEARETDQNH